MNHFLQLTEGGSMKNIFISLFVFAVLFAGKIHIDQECSATYSDIEFVKSMGFLGDGQEESVLASVNGFFSEEFGSIPIMYGEYQDNYQFAVIRLCKIDGTVIKPTFTNVVESPANRYTVLMGVSDRLKFGKIV